MLIYKFWGSTTLLLTTSTVSAMRLCSPPHFLTPLSTSSCPQTSSRSWVKLTMLPSMTPIIYSRLTWPQSSALSEGGRTANSVLAWQWPGMSLSDQLHSSTWPTLLRFQPSHRGSLQSNKSYSSGSTHIPVIIPTNFELWTLPSATSYSRSWRTYTFPPPSTPSQDILLSPNLASSATYIANMKEYWQQTSQKTKPASRSCTALMSHLRASTLILTSALTKWLWLMRQSLKASSSGLRTSSFQEWGNS